MSKSLKQSGVARIGEFHGYSFDGDFVQLNAELNFADSVESPEQCWSLQLWASESGFPAGQLAGVKVAELAVEPLTGASTIAAEVAALPPAGTAQQVMALVLVACGADGVAEVADLALYAVPEQFVQPCLCGEVSCVVADGVAKLTVEAIGNSRAPDNLSGTLALEVWALDQPYAGGIRHGVPVASVILGVLAGGNAWSNCDYEVPAALPESAAFLTVMLREWGPAGYVTRDYRNFAVTPAVAEVAVEAAVAAPAAAKKAAPKAEKKADKKAAKAEVKAEVKAEAKEAKAEAKAPAAKESKVASKKTVAVNSASEAELVAVKGLGATVARAIIAGRPYKSLDELSRVKGLGAKLLAKLREFLSL